MSLDVGDVLPFRIEVRDPAGVLVDATGGVCTLTLPDNTVDTPTLTHVSTGIYDPVGTCTLVGRYSWTYTATSPQVGLAGAFEVDDGSAGIVSLEEVKAHLNETGTDNDEELRGFILVASEWVEGIVGPVVRRTVTETVTPSNGMLVLARPGGPALSLTSVVGAYGYGITYQVGSLFLDGDAGIVHSGLTSLSFGCWPLDVTYVVGRVTVPASIQWAVKEYVAWAWETQRGAAQSAVGADFGDTPTAFATVPRRIEAALARYRRGVVA